MRSGQFRSLTRLDAKLRTRWAIVAFGALLISVGNNAVADTLGNLSANSRTIDSYAHDRPGSKSAPFLLRRDRREMPLVVEPQGWNAAAWNTGIEPLPEVSCDSGSTAEIQLAGGGPELRFPRTAPDNGRNPIDRDSIAPDPIVSESIAQAPTPLFETTSCRQCCNCCEESWLDNLSLFAGLEGSKQPQDFGVNAHFGGRVAANVGIPIWREYGLGAQIGVAYNATDHAVQVMERVEGNSSRNQLFSTVGLFQRFDSGWAWGVAYDFLEEDYFDDFSLSQWRIGGSYDVGCFDQVGIRIAIADRSDSGFFDVIPVTLSPISQGHIYWRHTFESSTELGMWAGIAEEHAESNVALGDLSDKDDPFLFGADVYAPLNDRLALYGEANFIMPADTGTVDAFLGIVYYPRGGAVGARDRQYAPLLPLAGNPSISVDLTR